MRSDEIRKSVIRGFILHIARHSFLHSHFTDFTDPTGIPGCSSWMFENHPGIGNLLRIVLRLNVKLVFPAAKDNSYYHWSSANIFSDSFHAWLSPQPMSRPEFAWISGIIAFFHLKSNWLWNTITYRVGSHISLLRRQWIIFPPAKNEIVMMYPCHKTRVNNCGIPTSTPTQGKGAEWNRQEMRINDLHGD